MIETAEKIVEALKNTVHAERVQIVAEVLKEMPIWVVRFSDTYRDMKFSFDCLASSEKKAKDRVTAVLLGLTGSSTPPEDYHIQKWTLDSKDYPRGTEKDIAYLLRKVKAYEALIVKNKLDIPSLDIRDSVPHPLDNK